MFIFCTKEGGKNEKRYKGHRINNITYSGNSL